MNKKIYLIVGIIAITFLGGCKTSETELPEGAKPNPVKTSLEDTQTKSETPLHYLLGNITDLPSRSVELVLEKKDPDPYTTVVTIKAKNPEKHDIQSVRTWLTYDPEKLKAVKIDTSNSPFQIAAPEENSLEPLFGLIKIGRATVSETVKNEEIEIAKIVFVKKMEDDEATIVDFYNHKGNKGHTQVNVVLKEHVINVAKKPESPALLIRK